MEIKSKINSAAAFEGNKKGLIRPDRLYIRLYYERIEQIKKNLNFKGAGNYFSIESIVNKHL